ncbi:MAG TPA: SDR family oxidoreductase [Gemmatimonadaceae bacterium]|jgi:3-oxoacyl-[acyl-carrier protein] reductase|nr:SDR family oxidoreductase [Gemmatimonadaceae bacterium]
MIDLKGKRALVTGGSRGIGAATALLLAQCGADVGIGYRNREKDAEEVVRRISSFGVRGFAHASDLSVSGGAESLFARAKRELGGLDLFVGNAGIWPFDDIPVGEMSDDRWHTTMRANMDSMFTTTRAAVRTISDHGRIVLVSSTAGQRGEAGHSDYAASRGAMISFVKSVAIELAARDVTINSVAPGWVDTEMAAQSLEGDGRAKVERTIPLGRVATAKDIAGPIVFLCSDFARHITGEVLNVNGGSVLCG